MKFSPIDNTGDFHDQARQELLLEAQPDEILWVPVRDRVVDCDLRIHCLAERSVDQLLEEVRAALNDAREGLSFPELTSRIGCQSRLSRRIVGEILRVMTMESVGETRCDADLVFHAIPKSLTQMPARESVFERRLRYVPRSRQLAPDIPALARIKLEGLEFEHNLLWWRPPAEEERELYGYARLAAAISLTFAEQFDEQSLPKTESGARDEVLQRSRLISKGLRFAGVSLTRIETLDRWLVHSCYLFRSSGVQGSGWNIRVYRYPRGGEQHGYTRYLMEQTRTNVQYLDSLKSRAVPIE